MRPVVGMSRSIHTAGKDHSCFAACGAVIPKGESYINDKLTQVVGNTYRPIAKTEMSLAWHMKCAPLTNADAKQILEDAVTENAKHPTRLGVDA